MLLQSDTLELVAIGGAVTGFLGLALGVSSSVRLRSMRRAYEVLQGGSKRDDFVTAVNRHADQVSGLRGQVGGIEKTLEQVQLDLSDAIRHVAVVRYDAFPDMGGRLSFSLAMVDDAGDGLVLTSINGRSETRTYAKGVKNGRSDVSLSPEETQVIGFATRSARG